MLFLNSIHQTALKHPFAFWFLFPVCILSLAVIGLDPIKIDCRFLYMVSDISEYGVHVTSTINGSTYPDYLSPFFILSWIASCGGHFLNRFTLALPSILCGSLSIALTCKIGEFICPRAGHLAALLCLATYHFIDTFHGFGLDSFVCLCAMLVLYVFVVHKNRTALCHVIFAGALIVSFFIRGVMGPVLIGAGSAAFLLAQKNWKGVLTYGVIGALSLAVCCIGFWFALHEEGGRELWNLCVDWQFGNRFTYQEGDPLFYLVYTYGMYVPASIPFLFTLIVAKKNLFQSPLFGFILYVLAIEILLSIPNCQHLRYMTLALPPMALAGAYGTLNFKIPSARAAACFNALLKLITKIVALLVIPSFLICALVCFILKLELSYWNVAVGLVLEILLLHMLKISKDFPGRNVAFLLISVTFIICFQILPVLEAAEKTSTSVRATEQLRGDSPLYFYFIDADHDGIKYLSSIDRNRVKSVYFISDIEEFRPPESTTTAVKEAYPVYGWFADLLQIHHMTVQERMDYPWHLYNYVSEEEALRNYRHGVFILRDREAEEEKFLATMKKYQIVVERSGTLRLGHRQYLIYR